jgi:heterodisulfide reductase subunit C/nitrate reductase gamma subunit
VSPLLLKWGLRVALGIAAAGLLWHLGAWLRRWIGPAGERPSVGARVADALRGAGTTLVSRRLPRVLWSLLADVFGQQRLVRRDPVRGAAHLAIAVGFTALLLLHALGAVLTSNFFKSYHATINPWYWLRDLAGLLVVLGLVVGALRRRGRRARLPRVRRRDPVFVGLLAVVLASGFVLAAVKIISAPAFERMAKENSSESGDGLHPLRALWAQQYGVVFPAGAVGPDHAHPSAATLAAGRKLDEESCTSCHSRPHAAFVSYPVSVALRPAAGPLGRAHAERWLLHLHVLCCFLGLAYLPFGRFLHVVADPVSLLWRAGAGAPTPAGRASRRALALDACVRCGLCDETCSVRALAEMTGNDLHLPSAKLLAARAEARGAARGHEELVLLSAGAYACTDCGRCTRGCPIGLDLEDLWAAQRADLAGRGRLAAAHWIKATPAAAWAERLAAAAPAAHAPALAGVSLEADRRAFAPCVQCQTCTNVCPVVAHSGGEGGVDATPQKVMNLLRLGLVDLALGSRMVWDCATCYQCQEHCPAGIRVTDLLYELRNRGWAELGELGRAIDVGTLTGVPPPPAGGAL